MPLKVEATPVFFVLIDLSLLDQLISLFVSLLPGHCDVSYCLLDAIEIIEIILMRNHPPAVS